MEGIKILAPETVKQPKYATVKIKSNKIPLNSLFTLHPYAST